MDLEQSLKQEIGKAVQQLYAHALPEVKLEATNKEFLGNYTFVVFPLLKVSKKKPEETAAEIGEILSKNSEWVAGFNVVKGFLNIEIAPAFWLKYLQENWNAPNQMRLNGQKVMVEYSSPNTNKPIHLGHVRNNLLGYSLSQILKASGNEVIKANLVNDRGIHICKSMLAWQRYGNAATPESAQMKGDHLVGKYYVVFENELRKEVAPLLEKVIGGETDFLPGEAAEKAKNLLQQLSNAETEEKKGKSRDELKEIVRNNSPLMLDCQEMLRNWEAGDAETIALWKMMNAWVYAGFNETYTRLGVDFDTYYYESNTYKLGKDLIDEGLEAGVFYRKEDGSVWIDLSNDGLDHKLVLRKDGTSVYMTQDIGTADLKYKEYGMDHSINVVGNEQEYHFKVLYLIMKKLGKPYAAGMYHLSYGMVDLPDGKMKSREGTVVDADELMDKMHSTAREKTMELGKTEGMENDALETLYEKLGMAALKFYILKVDPRKRMLFNPSESIDFHGDTGPFVLYTYTRIQSILRNAGDNWEKETKTGNLNPFEADMIEVLYRMESVIAEAAKEYSPALICQYCLELAKVFNRFYNECPILKEADAFQRTTRLQITYATSKALQQSLGLLGIETVERM